MHTTHLLFPLTVGLLTVPAALVSVAPPDALMPATVAVPDRVYPPLPSLAMLPPGGSAEIRPAPAVHTRSSKRKVVTTQQRKVTESVPHMVVSEASHTYLAGIERQLEVTLQRQSTISAGAVMPLARLLCLNWCRLATAPLLVTSSVAVRAASGDCFEQAGTYQGVNPTVLRAIVWSESKDDAGAIHRNADGSVDISQAQIDSIHFGALARYGVPRHALTDACVNVFVAA